jgi:hypothetical protein
VDTLNVKELVRQYWNRRAAEFDLEASHGLLTDAQASASIKSARVAKPVRTRN